MKKEKTGLGADLKRDYEKYLEFGQTKEIRIWSGSDKWEKELRKKEEENNRMKLKLNKR